MGLHTGSTYRTDFFLIHKDTAHASFGRAQVQHGTEGGICTHPVILSVGQNHAAVKAGLSRLSGRNHLQLRRDKVFLFDSILFL